MGEEEARSNEEPLAAAADVPAVDEPRTPGWLTAVGAAMLVAGAVVWAVTPRSVPPSADDFRGAVSAPAAQPLPPPPAIVSAPTRPVPARAPGCGAK